LESQTLEHIVVKGYRFNEASPKLPEVHGTYIIGGHKSEVLQVQDLPANLAEKKLVANYSPRFRELFHL
jgi:Fe(3+) dicitrate transport protein